MASAPRHTPPHLAGRDHPRRHHGLRDLLDDHIGDLCEAKPRQPRIAKLIAVRELGKREAPKRLDRSGTLAAKCMNVIGLPGGCGLALKITQEAFMNNGTGHARKKWIAKAVVNSHKGDLHRTLGVPLDETIPPSKLRQAASKPGVTGKRARLAITLSKLHHK